MSGEADRWVQPDWWGPPAGWIGGALPSTIVVALSEAGAILVENATVYPTGIGFELRALLRPEPLPTFEPGEIRSTTSETSATGEPDNFSAVSSFVHAGDYEPPEVATDRVRFGFEFADGRRVEREASVCGPGDFTILAFQEGKAVAPDPTVNAVLNFSNGGGSPDSLRENRFLWPLPEGDLELFASWPDADLAEQRATIEARTVAEALSRSRDVFDGRA